MTASAIGLIAGRLAEGAGKKVNHLIGQVAQLAPALSSGNARARQICHVDQTSGRRDERATSPPFALASGAHSRATWATFVCCWLTAPANCLDDRTITIIILTRPNCGRARARALKLASHISPPAPCPVHCCGLLRVQGTLSASTILARDRPVRFARSGPAHKSPTPTKLNRSGGPVASARNRFVTTVGGGDRWALDFWCQLDSIEHLSRSSPRRMAPAK